MPTTRRSVTPPALRRGEILLEALLSAVLLAGGALAWLGLAAALLRDERRAVERARAAALLAERATGWPAEACAPADGARRVGTLDERWRVAWYPDGRDSALVLADTLHAPDDPRVGRAGLVAVRACRP